MSKSIIHTKKYEKFIFINKLIAFSFSFIILTLYFSFILMIGFKPEILSKMIGSSFVTVGIITGLSIIIFSIFLTFIYTIIANKYLDKLKDKL